jgi:hypothetical protein
MIIKLPKNTDIEVRYEHGQFEAVWNWNDGELDSKLDFTEPLFGIGQSEAEAIGNLIINSNRAWNVPIKI